jgi:type III secretion protein V
MFPLGEECAAIVGNRVKRDGDAAYLAIPPELTKEFLSAVRERIGDLPPGRQAAIVVESPRIRRLVRRVVELEFPAAKVVARRELEDLDPRRLTYGPEITRG